MNFTLEKSIEILERTPHVLNALLKDISSDWSSKNEGGDTWSPYDIVGHLIHGEKTDWIPRMKIILSAQPDRNFVPFDRFAQFEESNDKSLTTLLDEFAALRSQNIAYLKSQKDIIENLNSTGVHPVFGDVTLRQLLSTWVVHDLNHISQISRVMANQYKAEVGPWIAYLKILQQ
jgi:hypothetical protein